MDSEKIFAIVVGLIILLIGWFTKVIFYSRQLYVVSENLYKKSLLTDKGVVCEISIFNRGRQLEEDIEITLDNSLNYELLAYNDTNASLDKNIIKINRLHKKTKVGVLILIENGEFTHNKILKVESKTERGKVVEKLMDVPMNHIDGLLVFMIFFLFIILGGLGGYYFRELYSEMNFKEIIQGKQEYKLLSKIGWLNLDKYFESHLSKSYVGSEFPIRFVERESKNKYVVYTFEIFNKTTFPMDISVDVADKSFMQDIELKGGTYENLNNIPPLSKAILRIKPIPVDKFKILEFTVITRGTSYDTNDFIYDLKYRVE